MYLFFHSLIEILMSQYFTTVLQCKKFYSIHLMQRQVNSCESKVYKRWENETILFPQPLKLFSCFTPTWRRWTCFSKLRRNEGSQLSRYVKFQSNSPKHWRESLPSLRQVISVSIAGIDFVLHLLNTQRDRKTYSFPEGVEKKNYIYVQT